MDRYFVVPPLVISIKGQVISIISIKGQVIYHPASR